MDGGGVPAAAFSLSKGMNKPQQVDHIHGEEQELHVLAVDDNLIDRKIVEKLLKNSSCKVTTAENGLMALEYLGLRDDQKNTLNGSGSKVNMIITDYCMPGMSGYELLKKIKESSILKEVPVVIMSSENIPTRINKCLEEGAQMFMLKPLKQSDVRKLRGQLTKCGKANHKLEDIRKRTYEEYSSNLGNGD